MSLREPTFNYLDPNQDLSSYSGTESVGMVEHSALETHINRPRTKLFLDMKGSLPPTQTCANASYQENQRFS